MHIVRQQRSTARGARSGDRPVVAAQKLDRSQGFLRRLYRQILKAAQVVFIGAGQPRLGAAAAASAAPRIAAAVPKNRRDFLMVVTARDDSAVRHGPIRPAA
jgi:hypothetical protein